MEHLKMEVRCEFSQEKSIVVCFLAMPLWRFHTEIKCLPLGPFHGSYFARVFPSFPLARNAVDFDTVCQRTEFHGQKGSSAWCGGLIWA